MTQALHNITVSFGNIDYDLKPARIVATKNHITINCTSISIEAIELLMAKHKLHFPDSDEKILQDNTSIPMGIKY